MITTPNAQCLSRTKVVVGQSPAVLGRGLITDGCDSASSTNRHASTDCGYAQRPLVDGRCRRASTVCNLAAPGSGVAVPRRTRRRRLRNDAEAFRIGCTGLRQCGPAATGAAGSACSGHVLASMASRMRSLSARRCSTYGYTHLITFCKRLEAQARQAVLRVRASSPPSLCTRRQAAALLPHEKRHP
jgi:hypothetical protein